MRRGENKMSFWWLCPECDAKNYYKGKKTTDAVTSCSSCRLKLRIFQHKVVVSVPNKPPKTTQKPQFYLNGDLKSLIIALNYAINTIKNKKEVREKKIDSTWYFYWKEWTRIRKSFQMELNKIRQ